MSKYTFICEEESTPYSIVVESKKTVEFRADSLEDVLQQFESFLRGSGFVFDGYLDIVKPDEEIKYQDDSDFSDIPHNNWIFGDLKPQSVCESEYSAPKEKCPVCKIPKSIMMAEKCYDKECPKSSFFTDYDYKIASEK